MTTAALTRPGLGFWAGLGWFGVSTVLFRRRDPIVGSPTHSSAALCADATLADLGLGRAPSGQHVTCRIARTSLGSRDSRTSQALSVGRATRSIPRLFASSWTSGSIGSAPSTPVPTIN